MDNAKNVEAQYVMNRQTLTPPAKAALMEAYVNRLQDARVLLMNTPCLPEDKKTQMLNRIDQAVQAAKEGLLDRFPRPGDVTIDHLREEL